MALRSIHIGTRGAERRPPLVPFAYMYQIIGASEMEFGEELG